MLAHDLLGEAPGEIEVLAPRETELDITQESVVRSALADLTPDVVINAAAYTNVDKAESEPEQAFRITSEAVRIVGRVAASLGDTQPLVVHYSTDYVFGGGSHRAYREDDETDPLGVYGRSKLAGERELAASGCRYMILRTQWLFGIRGKSFPRTMWERAGSRQPARVVSDQTGRPTYTSGFSKEPVPTSC
jgi:dTDP-4-dehydrorhamnose reductase